MIKHYFKAVTKLTETVVLLKNSQEPKRYVQVDLNPINYRLT